MSLPQVEVNNQVAGDVLLNELWSQLVPTWDRSANGNTTSDLKGMRGASQEMENYY